MVRLHQIFSKTRAEIVLYKFFKKFCKNLKKQKNDIWVKWGQIAKKKAF